MAVLQSTPWHILFKTNTPNTKNLIMFYCVNPFNSLLRSQNTKTPWSKPQSGTIIGEYVSFIIKRHDNTTSSSNERSELFLRPNTMTAGTVFDCVALCSHFNHQRCTFLLTDWKSCTAVNKLRANAEWKRWCQTLHFLSLYYILNHLLHKYTHVVPASWSHDRSWIPHLSQN